MKTWLRLAAWESKRTWARPQVLATLSVLSGLRLYSTRYRARHRGIGPQGCGRACLPCTRRSGTPCQDYRSVVVAGPSGCVSPGHWPATGTRPRALGTIRSVARGKPSPSLVCPAGGPRRGGSSGWLAAGRNRTGVVGTHRSWSRRPGGSRADVARPCSYAALVRFDTLPGDDAHRHRGGNRGPGGHHRRGLPSARPGHITAGPRGSAAAGGWFGDCGPNGATGPPFDCWRTAHDRHRRSLQLCTLCPQGVVIETVGCGG